MALIHCYGDNPLADSYAKDAAEILVKTYPNHSWWIECKQGVLIIKHLEASGYRGSIGMIRHTNKLSHDAKVRKQDFIRAAGEMLERAGLKRGANNGDLVKKFEFDDHSMERHWHAPIRVPVIH